MSEIKLTQIQELLQTELKPVKRDLRTMKKDINLVIEYFEDSTIKLRKRVDHIENILSTSSS